MTTRRELLARVRAKQMGALEALSRGPTKPLRFILEHEQPRDPAAIVAEIRNELEIEVFSARLSAAHGEWGVGGDDGLAQFTAVTIVGIEAAEVTDSPFELGYALADATKALTAEPELGTDFFLAQRAGEGQLESIDDFPPGCWVSPDADPTPQQPLWAVKNIKASDAWKLAPSPGGKTKGEGILVFQPDTGVADHVELGGGMIGTTLAFDFVENKKGAVDPMNYSGNPGHGTGTASVVASREAGKMAGAAPLATLVPLRAVLSVIVFDHGRVAAAVEYARRKGANVITMSLGGAWSSSLRAAIDRAIDDGIIVLAAAGNCVGFVVWPARYEEVIAVAGYNIKDEPWKGSCHGDAVDIAAPGEFVPRANRAPQNGGSPTDVRGGQGTSFSVALTAGIAALWMGHHGIAAIKQSLHAGETVQDRFVSLLKATARQPSPWREDEFGAGIVDAKKLLEHSLQPPGGQPEAAVAAADPMWSVRSILVELAPAKTEGLEDLAGSLFARRYAAELSHLALLKQKKITSGGAALERVEVDTPPSETLQREFAAIGRTDLIEVLS